MVTDERYAEEWHGLFPRFVLAGLVFAFVGILLQLLVDALIPLPVPIPSSGAILRFEVQDVVSIAFFPFVVFGLFYLSSRVRVNLWKDFFPVASSIFLGALVALLIFGLPEVIQANPGNGPVYAILQSTASAVYGSISYAFVGFVAVLISYRRRL